MISEKIGTILKKNTKTKIWWSKVGVALVVSNIFFFLLFSEDSKVKDIEVSGIPAGWVEVQLNAELMTPFHSGKKVLIVHRIGRERIEGVLQETGVSELGKITILVKELEAHKIFQHDKWEVLPYLKNLSFMPIRKEESHEIRY